MRLLAIILHIIYENAVFCLWEQIKGGAVAVATAPHYLIDHSQQIIRFILSRAI